MPLVDKGFPSVRSEPKEIPQPKMPQIRARAWELNRPLPDPESIFCHFRMDALQHPFKKSPKKYLKLGSRPRTGPGLEALILESAGHDSASSLGVALFALTSALSRVVVGILSDKYQGYFTRFHWVTDSWPGTSDMSCDVFLDDFFWCKWSRWNTKKPQKKIGWKNWENMFRMQSKYDDKKGWKLKNRNSSLAAWTSHSICSSDMFAVWRSADLMPQWSWIEEKLSQAWYVLGLIWYILLKYIYIRTFVD